MSNSTYLAKGEDVEFEIIISDSGYITLKSLGERNPTELELFSAVRQILAPIFFPANPRVHPADYITKPCHDSSLIIMEQTTYTNGTHYPSKQTILYGLNAHGEITNLCAHLRDVLDLMIERRELRIDFIKVNKRNYDELNLNIRPDERDLLSSGLLVGRVYFYDTFIEELPDVHITVENNAATTPLCYSPEFVLLNRVYFCQLTNCEYCAMECDRRVNN